MTIEKSLADLQEALRAELAQPRPLRGSAASDDDLRWAVGHVTETQELFALGEVARATGLVAEIARKAVDELGLTAELTDQVAGCAQALRVLKDPRR